MLAGMEDDTPLLTIGQLSERTGLPVRTIRFWSDAGLVPPVKRSGSGRRLYGAECLMRLELVSTLRELGLGLPDVRRVLAGGTSMAEVAAVHAEALGAQIRTLRLHRAVLTAIARRDPSTEEIPLMNRMARLSAAERKQIIDGFVAEVFQNAGSEPGFAAHMRKAPDLPDDPTPEQVDAWVELAELVQDHGFRERIRGMAEYSARALAGGGPSSSREQGNADFVARVLEFAGSARERGVVPGSREAAEVVEAILAGSAEDRHREQLLAELEVFTDARAERYWQLTGIINGWPPFPARVPAFEWLIAAMRAHD